MLTIVKITITALLSENKESANESIEYYGERTRPPYHRVSNEVDLFMIFDPEVLWPDLVNRVNGKDSLTYNAPTKKWPRARSRIKSMTLCKSRIRSPHDSLQLKEFAEKSGKSVIDLRCIGRI
jgi:hypothetical protein